MYGVFGRRRDSGQLRLSFRIFVVVLECDLQVVSDSYGRKKRVTGVENVGRTGHSYVPGDFRVSFPSLWSLRPAAVLVSSRGYHRTRCRKSVRGSGGDDDGGGGGAAVAAAAPGRTDVCASRAGKRNSRRVVVEENDESENKDTRAFTYRPLQRRYRCCSAFF